MSSIQRRTARDVRAGDQKRFDTETVDPETTNDATPERFATSGTPHAVGGEAWENMTATSLQNTSWPQFWTAADGGESEAETPEADGGDATARVSQLSGLMLEVFDDDEHWRELARTGRAL